MDATARKHALEQELASATADLASLESDPTLKIGLLGVRGSCKSSLLAAWYWLRTDPHSGLSIHPDEVSMLYLSTIVTNLQEKGSTQATPAASPDIVRFDLRYNNELWKVETMDCAGAFYSPQEAGPMQKLAQAPRAFLRTCDVVLCLCYWKESDVATINALDICLRDYKSLVILALTKFDETGLCPRSASEIVFE
jgi:hypothetical protein